MLLLTGPVVPQSQTRAAARATELEGTWDAVAVETSNGTRPWPADVPVRLTFTGGTLVATNFFAPPGPPSRTERRISFTLRSGATPKQLDFLMAPDRTIAAVYDVNGATLRIATTEFAESKRPAAVAPTPFVRRGGTVDRSTPYVTVIVLKKRS
jgi:uncharacterized protein (TIGR03067 family)